MLTPVLVADRAEGFAVFRQAVGRAVSLVHASTYADALRLLQPPPPLVVCGCYFDDDAMYDLLRELKSRPGCERVPFLAVRCEASEMSLEDTVYDSVKVAVKALGGDDFIDFAWWRQRFGEEEAARRLVGVVENLLRR